MQSHGQIPSPLCSVKPPSGRRYGLDRVIHIIEKEIRGTSSLAPPRLDQSSLTGLSLESAKQNGFFPRVNPIPVCFRDSLRKSRAQEEPSVPTVAERTVRQRLHS